MENTLTTEQAECVASLAKAKGFDVSADEVLDFARDGWLPASVVSDDYDQAREDFLQEALDEVQS